MLELVEELALSLNNPLGINIGISFDRLLDSTLWELERYIKLIKKASKKG